MLRYVFRFLVFSIGGLLLYIALSVAALLLLEYAGENTPLTGNTPAPLLTPRSSVHSPIEAQTLDDIDWQTGELRILAKGRQQAQMPIPSEVAKANGLEPYAYLRHVFTELPKAVTTADIEALLPWNVTLPATQSVAAKSYSCQYRNVPVEDCALTKIRDRQPLDDLVGPFVELQKYGNACRHRPSQGVTATGIGDAAVAQLDRKS